MGQELEPACKVGASTGFELVREQQVSRRTLYSKELYSNQFVYYYD